MIVFGVVIDAVLLLSLGALSFLPRLHTGDARNVRTSAMELRRAAETWQGTHESDVCPTPQRLRDDGAIDRASKITDAWDSPFRITCAGDDSIYVTSFGPDRLEGTSDDIQDPIQYPPR